MPVRELPPLPKSLRLSDLDGKGPFTITEAPLQTVNTRYGLGTLATLSTGEKVFLPKHVVENFYRTHAGKYRVRSWEDSRSPTGRGYALENADTPPQTDAGEGGDA